MHKTIMAASLVNWKSVTGDTSCQQERCLDEVEGGGLLKQCISSTLGFSVGWSSSSRSDYRVFVRTVRNEAVDVESVQGECGFSIARDGAALHFTAAGDACHVRVEDGRRKIQVELQEMRQGLNGLVWAFTIDCPENLRSARAGEIATCSGQSRNFPCNSVQSVPSADVCAQSGCCYDPTLRRCFYSEAVCTTDGRFVVPVSRNLTSPPLDLSTVHLTGGSSAQCSPVLVSADLAVFDVPMAACGATVQWSGQELVYELMLVSERELCVDGSVAITKSSTYKMVLQCRFLGSGDLQLGVQVSTLPPPPPATATGPLSLLLQVFTDNSYTTPYQPWQYPLVTLLGTPLYVQASLLHRSDPTLVLFLKDCWATPTTDATDPTQWKLVVDGVFFPGVADLPLPSHYKRLALQAFAFMNSDRSTTRDLVYLHCSIVVCDSSSPNFLTECNRQCGQTRRYSEQHHRDLLNIVLVYPKASQKRNAISDASSVVGKHVVSLQGPVLFEEAPVNDAALLLLEAPSSSWASAGTLSFSSSLPQPSLLSCLLPLPSGGAGAGLWRSTGVAIDDYL
ncbi:zona pellucida sperm-binding protein 4-like [Callorhinchus milii]|uniref:zona pellucida sperm-binding protein 4-like n=1 Tax=Callorhinchus milii TaxID=7868 RepID=UPI001C3FEFEF|nr:zona pellucida sperm-binding protein 4-like [Callorhinchus milii]